MSTPGEELAPTQRVDVNLRRTATQPTPDQALWSAIRNRTDAVAFNRYSAFIEKLFDECKDDDGEDAKAVRKSSNGERNALAMQLNSYLRRSAIHGADAYLLLKFATHAFLAYESGVAVKPPQKNQGGAVVPGEESRLDEEVTYEELQERLKTYLQQEVGGIKGEALPYLKRIVQALLGTQVNDATNDVLVLRRQAFSPSLVELIWSYWHEEGMLVQTMNAISLRFQNRRMGANDPLANLEIDPLRPVATLMWGFIQDEINRLSVVRRAHEYRHHYGLAIYGKAVGDLDPADDRPRFIEAFHNLLHRAAVFYQEDADTTLISDGFPLLNALKEVHVILAEGAHNQFVEMPRVARAEMMIMQWLLARPELREFLRGRAMVPYREPWMAQVDTMKRLQGWSDVSITHFRDLAAFGEKILLSVRYGDWIEANDQDQARNWARYWKPEIQSYIHSYLATTGVDLAADTSDTRRAEDRYVQPGLHLRNRLAAQQSRSTRSLTVQTKALSEELSISPRRRLQMLQRLPRE